MIETFPGWLELPLTGTNFYGRKPVRATEVLLFITALRTVGNTCITERKSFYSFLGR